MINLCWFKEFDSDFDTGSITDFLIDSVPYSKTKAIDYLKRGNKIASCPRKIKDPITKEVLRESFSVLSDGEYCWVNILPLLIEKYNIRLPEEFCKRIGD